MIFQNVLLGAPWTCFSKPCSAGLCLREVCACVHLSLSCTKIERVLLPQNPSVLWLKSCRDPVGTAPQSLGFLRQLCCRNVIPTPKSPKERRKRPGYAPVKMSPLGHLRDGAGPKRTPLFSPAFFTPSTAPRKPGPKILIFLQVVSTLYPASESRTQALTQPNSG